MCTIIVGPLVAKDYIGNVDLGCERECLEGVCVERKGFRTPVAGVFEVLLLTTPVTCIAVDVSVPMQQ